MVISGKDCDNLATVEEVAEATVRVLKKCVPAEVPGIAFLSGGQSDIQATEHLNEMNTKYELPWRLTFSYGRAIQQPALHFWAEDIKNNIVGAQEKLVHRAKMNGAASNGEYKSEMEQKFTS